LLLMPMLMMLYARCWRCRVVTIRCRLRCHTDSAAAIAAAAATLITTPLMTAFVMPIDDT